MSNSELNYAWLVMVLWKNQLTNPKTSAIANLSHCHLNENTSDLYHGDQEKWASFRPLSSLR